MRPASEVAAALVGDPVLWVISDPTSGALLELGKRRLHPRRIPNSALTHEQREYEGEHSLFVQCHWEMRFPNGAPGAHRRSEGSRSLELLDRVEGLVIAAATVDERKLDLTVTFDNGVLLRVDPTVRPSRLGGGYSVRIDRVYWSVGDDGRVTEERAPTLTRDEHALLLEAIDERRPDLRSLVAELVAGERRLSADEGNALRDAVGNELARMGFGRDWEPTARGVALEKLIDKLGRITAVFD
jgi:hypothetical protein